VKVTENSVEEAWDSTMGGGFFADAGVELDKVADDPYGFGQSYHIIAIKEWRAPAVSPTGKFGSYIIFEYLEDRYKDMRPFGRWYQLPTPKAIQIQTGVPFDPENDPKDQQVAFTLKRLLWALGFNVDQMNTVNPSNSQGRPFLAKLFAAEEGGFWKVGFGTAGIKRMPEPGTEEYNALFAPSTGDPMGEFAKPAAGKKRTPEEILRDEIENA
jgi:hypothetical protein